MSQDARFKTVSEMSRIVTRQPNAPRGILAPPVPVWNNKTLHVVVFFYREAPVSGNEIVYPPHHMATVVATTGEIVESRPCIPKYFGVNRLRGPQSMGTASTRICQARCSGQESTVSERFHRRSGSSLRGLDKPRRQEPTSRQRIRSLLP